MKSKAIFHRQLALALVLLLFGLLWGCRGPAPTPERGHDPWVFRSVLDLQPRMVTLALRDSFWVAYDAQRAALYKVWRDGVEFDGPVYTTAHGPQPVSLGDAYLVSPHREPWRVLRDGAEIRPRVQYRGHRFRAGQATLRYELHLDDGTRIVVTERPEYVEEAGGRHGLQRSFTTEGVPGGAQVVLHVHLNSLSDAGSYETDGRFEAGSPSEMVGAGAQVAMVEGRLALNANGPTRFTAWFHNAPMVLAEADEVEDEDKHPGLVLIEQGDCHACHNPEVKTVGPSYLAIAQRYEATHAAIGQLVEKIIQGGRGAWREEVGEALMTPHPDLHPEDVEQMVAYILALDEEEPPAEAPAESEEAGEDALAGKGPTYPIFGSTEDAPGNQGIAVNVYRFSDRLREMPDLSDDALPTYAGVVPALHARYGDFGDLDLSFYLEARGTLHIPQTTNYVFRLASDDGSVLLIDDKVVIDHGGLHGPVPHDGEVVLEAGPHPFTVRYFQGGGGRALSLQWAPHGAEGFAVVPPEVFTYDPATLKETTPYVPPKPLIVGIPGDGRPLVDVHPSFDLETARPSDFKPKVGGLDFLSDGRLVVSTWDPDGTVYLVSNLDAEDREAIRVERIAAGLAEPLGLTVVNDEIYVLQKHELTRLIDHDGDDVIDEYQTVCNSWQASANFHEFAFGLVYEDGYFYAALATAINPGGASTQPQIPDRGKVIKIAKDDGSFEFVAHGLRTPNGIGFGADGELFIADNQGDWLPASKIVHVQPGAWYGSRSVDFEGTEGLEETPPVVWLPQDEIGNSPTQPAPLDVGPYQGQMIHGEVTHGGLKRVFVEQVNGQYQGVVFRFTQGLEAGVNRVLWGPDGKLYVGGIGNPGNWGDYGKNWFGLQRLAYNGASAFEMLAVRARSNGLEIEFTEPLRAGDGFEATDYLVKQWWYQPTENYGGPKLDERALEIVSVNVSEDRKRVFLELAGMQPNHVVYLRLRKPFISQMGHELWTTEAWYTLNQIPPNQPGFASDLDYETVGPNALTEAEKAAGWRLLFDGETTNGWRNFRSDTIGAAWKVEDGTLTLSGEKEDWQFKDGGDIITDEAFENFELSLEWKIAEAGNSGIIYNVVESDEYDYAWQTGSEMQILDNDRHPDGQLDKHRAGDLYDLIQSDFVATRPVGAWNAVRLIQNNGHVEHWLNGHKVVEYEWGTEAWEALVAGSKFAEMPGFGKSNKGHIALQDHGDRVWYRNVKIRPL